MKRTKKDKIVSFLRFAYYRTYEPVKLFFVRRKRNYDSYKGLVSIIIPTYNRSKLLMERAVKSVLEQSYTHWELLIVGDGCTDDTEKMIRELNHPNIFFNNIKRVLPHHNYDRKKDWFIGGLYPRNYALNHKIRGEYIAMLDDDDIWHPEYLSLCLQAIENFDVEFISSGYKTITYNDLEEIHNGKPANEYFYEKKKDKKKCNPIIGAHSSFFYKSYLKFMRYNKNCWRKKWNKVNDTDLAYRMYKAKVRMGFIKAPLIVIKSRPNEYTRGYDAMQEKIKKIREIAKEVKK